MRYVKVFQLYLLWERSCLADIWKRNWPDPMLAPPPGADLIFNFLVFVYLCICVFPHFRICVCVFEFVYSYLCICISKINWPAPMLAVTPPPGVDLIFNSEFPLEKQKWTVPENTDKSIKQIHVHGCLCFDLAGFNERPLSFKFPPHLPPRYMNITPDPSRCMNIIIAISVNYNFQLQLDSTTTWNSDITIAKY